MDPRDIKKFSADLFNMLVQGTVALNTIQGIELGFFDWIPDRKTITAQELSVQMGYDLNKVERWLRFAVANGYLTESDSAYSLTPKGALLRRGTPAPDLLGLHHMFSYFTKAVQNSKEAYQNGVGLDSLSQGKISRDYIPRVASQLSRASAEFFKWSGLSTGHTILDLGCGNGSVLRETAKICPGISATGIDMNIHTLELGKRRNTDAGLQDQIELQVGDVMDLSLFRDNTFDWVSAINVFHFIPVNKRERLVREMIRISRYGIFFNQVNVNNLQTIAVDVLLATLFSDYAGFFTEAEADEIIRKTGIKHYTFLPIIQGESRLVVMYTSKNDAPLSRIPGISDSDRWKLSNQNLNTTKDLLVAEQTTLEKLGLDPVALRAAAIKLLLP
ncbi:MAG: class I SAM-dependent methyltransferase [Nitrospirota bacterium]